MKNSTANYQLTTFNSSLTEQFFDFCKRAAQCNDPAAVNMWADDWSVQSHTLPYIMINSSRYANPNGEFFLVMHQSEIVGCGGIYFSEFESKFALAGCRTWIDPAHRNQSLPRELLLPAQKQWAIDHKATAVGLTFNEYNKNLITTWKRTRLGERRTPRQQHHLFYDNFNELDYPVVIQYTKQWVVYERLDTTFDFDWASIKCR